MLTNPHLLASNAYSSTRKDKPMLKGKRIKSTQPVFGIVGLSAPDAKWYPDFYSAGIRALNERGIITVEGATVKSDYYYLAEKPQVIAASLHEMFLRKDVDAIMCAGGGVAINKILPFLDFQLIGDNIKPFIGISNITALMVAMLNNGISSFHGPFVIWSYGLPETPTEFTHTNMVNALSGVYGELPKVSQWQTFRDGEAEGEIIGGNLWSLATVVGTKYCPLEIFDGKILFLEDIGKTLDRIDAHLTLFKLLGVFKRVKGIVIGKLPDCKPPEKVSMSVRDFLEVCVGELDLPIIFDCDFGHVVDNLCLPLGCRVRLEATGGDPKLFLLEPGVA